MKPRRIVLASMVALAIVVVAAAACGGGSSNDASAVEKLLERQLALAKAGDWQGLYKTYSPRYQSRCPYDALLRRAAGSDSASAVTSQNRCSSGQSRSQVQAVWGPSHME